MNVDELLSLAQDCYARARMADAAARPALVAEGDRYLQQAESLQRGHKVVVAGFSNPGSSQAQGRQATQFKK